MSVSGQDPCRVWTHLNTLCEVASGTMSTAHHDRKVPFSCVSMPMGSQLFPISMREMDVSHSSPESTSSQENWTPSSTSVSGDDSPNAHQEETMAAYALLDLASASSTSSSAASSPSFPVPSMSPPVIMTTPVLHPPNPSSFVSKVHDHPVVSVLAPVITTAGNVPPVKKERGTKTRAAPGTTGKQGANKSAKKSPVLSFKHEPNPLMTTSVITSNPLHKSQPLRMKNKKNKKETKNVSMPPLPVSLPSGVTVSASSMPPTISLPGHPQPQPTVITNAINHPSSQSQLVLTPQGNVSSPVQLVFKSGLPPKYIHIVNPNPNQNTGGGGGPLNLTTAHSNSINMNHKNQGHMQQHHMLHSQNHCSPLQGQSMVVDLSKNSFDSIKSEPSTPAMNVTTTAMVGASPQDQLVHMQQQQHSQQQHHHHQQQQQQQQLHHSQTMSFPSLAIINNGGLIGGYQLVNINTNSCNSNNMTTGTLQAMSSLAPQISITSCKQTMDNTIKEHHGDQNIGYITSSCNNNNNHNGGGSNHIANQLQAHGFNHLTGNHHHNLVMTGLPGMAQLIANGQSSPQNGLINGGGDHGSDDEKSSATPIKEFRQRQRNKERQEDMLLKGLEDQYHSLNLVGMPTNLEILYDDRKLNIKFPRVKTVVKRGKAVDDDERTNRKKECARRDSKNYRERAKAKREVVAKKIALLESILREAKTQHPRPLAVQFVTTTPVTVSPTT